MPLDFDDYTKNVLPEFDRDSRTIRILVEGANDIPFWENVFKEYIPKDFHFTIDYIIDEESVQNTCGCKKIYKLLDKIHPYQTIIVALDSEYDDIIKDKIKYHNNLSAFTKRHSIENYLFCERIINKLISRFSRKMEIEENLINIHIFTNDIRNKLKYLLFLDCKRELCKINTDLIKKNKELFKENLKILGSKNSIKRFCNENSYIPEKELIDDFIKSNNLQNINTDDINKKFKNKNLYHFLNGHFIRYAVQLYIQKKSTRKNIKEADLYDNSYDVCLLCNQNCDYKDLKQQAKNIIDFYINKILEVSV